MLQKLLTKLKYKTVMKHLNHYIHLIIELASLSVPAVIKPVFMRACAWMVRAKRAARIGEMR